MRLPATTPQQQRTEEARVLHEELYAAWRSPDPHPRLLIVSPDRDASLQVTQNRIESNLHRFWGTRGFILRSRQVPERRAVEFWIEQIVVAEEGTAA